MLITIGTSIVVIWFYVLFARGWLDAHLQGTAYTWWHEKVEDVLWEKSRTILIARGYQIVGWLVSLQALAAAAGIDFSPVINEASTLVPERWRGLATGIFFILTGLIFAKLRKMTTGPVGQ